MGRILLLAMKGSAEEILGTAYGGAAWEGIGAASGVERSSMKTSEDMRSSVLPS